MVVPRSLRSVVQDAPDLLAVLGIEADRRLVEDQQIGPVERRASDVHEPPPSTGELSRHLCRARAESGLIHRSRDGGTSGTPTQSREPGGEEKIFLDRQETVDAGLLEYQAQAPANGRAMTPGVEAEEASGPAGGSQKGREQKHRRGLAGSVRTEEPDQRTLRDGESERTQRANAAIVAPQPFRFDRGGRGSHTRCGSLESIR